MVEYAVRPPGPQDEPGSCVWLPIDSKLPQEGYVRIQDAADVADAEAEPDDFVVELEPDDGVTA